jgi:uracil-DNA glycosylase family 4
MSFFFTKAKPLKVAYDKPASAGIASKATLNRLSCKVCPLDTARNCSPKMSPDTINKTDIYFLGDIPNKNDDTAGQPFSGKTGKLLKSILGNVDNHSFDNVIRDFSDPFAERPPPSWIAMECCRSLVTKSIEQAKPKLIVGLGILPLQWMLNSSDMVGLRGRVFAVKVGQHACWFLPTYHPQYILDTAYDDRQPLRSKLGHCLKFDILKAVKLAVSLKPPEIDTPQGARAGIQCFDGHGPGQLAKVLKLISEARKAPVKAIDVETSTLRPYANDAKLLTMALSFGSINFAFALDHPSAGWSVEDLDSIDSAIEKLLKDRSTIVAHHASFEIEWLVHRYGRNAIRHDVWECTMMQAHFIDERRGKRGGSDEQFQPNPYQALDFLVKQYFGLSYKGLFNLDRKNMVKADLSETLLYNGADTKYTLHLFSKQSVILQSAGLDSSYLESKGRQPAVALMQSIGIDIDQSQTKAMQKKLQAEITSIESQIKSDSFVQKFIAERKVFNPASNHDVLRILKDYLKVGKALLNADGKETVDKNTLAKIKHPLANSIETYRNRAKLKSTYIDVFELGRGAFIWPDGKIHPSFNTTFSETGRTSSDEPNQQNWPSRNDKWLRKQVVAPKNHVLVAFDYGQLEACTAAMCTQDKVLVKALWEDYDIHMFWTQKTAKMYPPFIERFGDSNDPLALKKARSVIKNKLVFPVIFGASNASVAGYLNIPIEPVNKLMTEFWDTFHGLYSWQKRTMNDYYACGYVSSPTGRRRHYPLTKNQAINYPIQSVACDIVCRAMVNLSQCAADTNKWYLHPTMNIHDDLTLCIPDQPQILEEAIEHIYRTMLAPVYDFINVPLSVTCSVGTNWLEMDEIGKFWSHRDL